MTDRPEQVGAGRLDWPDDMWRSKSRRNPYWPPHIYGYVSLEIAKTLRSEADVRRLSHAFHDRGFPWPIAKGIADLLWEESRGNELTAEAERRERSHKWYDAGNGTWCCNCGCSWADRGKNYCKREASADAGPSDSQWDYYDRGGIRCWDYIQAKELDFFEGNIVKYITRWRLKGEGVTDLIKARHYLNRLIEIGTEKEKKSG